MRIVLNNQVTNQETLIINRDLKVNDMVSKLKDIISKEIKIDKH